MLSAEVEKEIEARVKQIRSHHGGYIEDLPAVLRSLAEAVMKESGWRDIATAPKDPRLKILVYEKPMLDWQIGQAFAWWIHDFSYVAGGYWTDGLYVLHPTHWQPMPAPPTEAPRE